MTSQSRNDHLELVLFENDPRSATRLIKCGIGSFLVDLEQIGKDNRQLGFDTEINPGTIDDLRAISEIYRTRVWCRLNRFGTHTKDEVDSAISSGAAVLVLPMVTTLQEVRDFISLVRSRCEICIMIETMEGVNLAPDLEVMSIDCAYFGLNDFAISSGTKNIFGAVEDGTVEAVRRVMPSKRFGFGGLTHMSLGSPIPSSKLLEELSRLNCDFTFLRRSFRRDAHKIDASEIVRSIGNYWQTCKLRSLDKVSHDHQKLAEILAEISKSVRFY